MSIEHLNENLNAVAGSDDPALTALVLSLLESDLNVIQKLDDEPNDVGGLTAAELKAKFDEAGNVIKTYLNETLVPAISDTVAEAQVRAAAEAQRAANEQTRVTKETARVSAEKSRAEAETKRISAESVRAANENTRISEEKKRVSAESARAAAETARADKESGYVAQAKYWAEQAQQIAGGDFAPTSHAMQHGKNGADPITPASIGAAAEGYAPDCVDITDTTPTKAAKYYPLYAADKSGKQTVSANKDLYYYDMGTASYFNVGDTDQKGGLTLHASNGKYVNVVTSDAPAENRDITLPDVSGTVYTTGNKPTAADVGAAVNPNLFHNWYFGNPINQRGQTEYTTSGYTIDRWFANSASSSWISVFLHEDHLTLTHATSLWHHFAQQCDKKQIIVGETYTISALTNHGVLTRTFVYTGEDYTRSVGHDWCFYTTQRGGHPIFGLRTQVNGATIDVYAVKLEQGSVQTLAHQDSTGAWVLNEIPDQSEELLKCIQFPADSYDTYTGKTVIHTGNLGLVGAGQVVTGSYVGTGTYGAENPNSLTFDKPPKFLMLCYGSGGPVFTDTMQYAGMTDALTTEYTKGNWLTVAQSGWSYGYAKCSEDRKTISWYVEGIEAVESNISAQLNTSATTYRYLAIL